MRQNLKNLLKISVVTLATGLVLTGCSPIKNEKTEEQDNQVNTQKMITISDINKEDFKETAKVSYVIEGKMVSKPEEVTNVLEGTSYDVNPDEDVILKGTVDELWVTPLEKVLDTYSKEDGSKLTKEDFVADEFIKLKTQPGKTVFAAFVPVDTQVEINTAWGDKLIANRPEVEHGKGDYIVCAADEDGEPNFEDAWVVNGNVFETTYDMSSFK